MADWPDDVLHGFDSTEPLIGEPLGGETAENRGEATRRILAERDATIALLRRSLNAAPGAPELTPAERRALDASAELANAMRGIMPGVGENDQADHDFNEVCRSIHDVQARIIAIAGSRIGLPCRPIGATEESTTEWVQHVRTNTEL